MLEEKGWLIRALASLSFETGWLEKLREAKMGSPEDSDDELEWLAESEDYALYFVAQLPRIGILGAWEMLAEYSDSVGEYLARN